MEIDLEPQANQQNSNISQNSMNIDQIMIEQPQPPQQPTLSLPGPLSPQDVFKIQNNSGNNLAPPSPSPLAVLTGSNLVAPAPATPAAATPAPVATPVTTSTTKGKRKSKASANSQNSNSSTPSGSASSSQSRSSKGLRHFSSKVCEKVQQKQTTTYNEVANDLVADYLETCKQNSTKTTASDEKNIRRRVYDALNVLMALGIITKEKKDIHWKGYPVDHQQELKHLNSQRAQVTDNIKRKRKQLEDLEKAYSANYNLIKRNQVQAKKEPVEENAKIKLPFIIVHTAQKTVIECQMDEEGTDIFLDFSDSFVLHDDNEILFQLGLGQQKPADMYEGLTIPVPVRPQDVSQPAAE